MKMHYGTDELMRCGVPLYVVSVSLYTNPTLVIVILL